MHERHMTTGSPPPSGELEEIGPADERGIFALGDVIADSYEVRAVLGQGGMGQVFDAWDRNLSRRVAIKANFLEVAQSVRVEAQGLAAIRHTGVVGVYAFGSHGGVDRSESTRLNSSHRP